MPETPETEVPAAELGELAPDPAQSVTVAYVTTGDKVSYSWHYSMIEMIGYDLVNSGRVLRGGHIAMQAGTDGLVGARNDAVREFVLDGKSDWLFWVDTDMGFPDSIVDQLMAAADPQERPIVGALCFSQRNDKPDGMGGWHTLATPTIFDWATVQGRQGFAVRWDYPINTVVRCAGTGSAAILIHRRVFEAIADKWGPIWYERIPNPSTGQLISEDLSFCLRACILHIPVHVHTGVRTSHNKTVHLGEQDYWNQRAVNPSPLPPPEALVVEESTEGFTPLDRPAAVASHG